MDSTKQYAAAGPWISVKDALPEVNKRVLLKIEYKGTLPDFYHQYWVTGWLSEDGKWSIGDMQFNWLTHWAEVRL